MDGPRKLKRKATRAAFAAGARRGKPSPSRFIKRRYVAPRVNSRLPAARCTTPRRRASRAAASVPYLQGCSRAQTPSKLGVAADPVSRARRVWMGSSRSNCGDDCRCDVRRWSRPSRRKTVGSRVRELHRSAQQSLLGYNLHRQGGSPRVRLFQNGPCRWPPRSVEADSPEWSIPKGRGHEKLGAWRSL